MGPQIHPKCEGGPAGLSCIDGIFVPCPKCGGTQICEGIYCHPDDRKGEARLPQQPRHRPVWCMARKLKAVSLCVSVAWAIIVAIYWIYGIPLSYFAVMALAVSSVLNSLERPR